jgi:hypothetical protein
MYQVTGKGMGDKSQARMLGHPWLELKLPLPIVGGDGLFYTIHHH